MMEVREASRVLGVSEDELRRIKAEMNSILTRYNVRSFLELDEKITSGALKGTDSFEDYTRLDYLDSQREKIEKVLGGDS